MESSHDESKTRCGLFGHKKPFKSISFAADTKPGVAKRKTTAESAPDEAKRLKVEGNATEMLLEQEPELGKRFVGAIIGNQSQSDYSHHQS